MLFSVKSEAAHPLNHFTYKIITAIFEINIENNVHNGNIPSYNRLINNINQVSFVYVSHKYQVQRDCTYHLMIISQ